MQQALGEALAQACARYGDATALQLPGQGAAGQRSHGSLAAAAELLAAQLREAGLRRDEPVLVLVSNLPGDIAALLAVWLAGGVVVAVHRSTPPAVLAGLQQRTGARCLLDLADLPAHSAAAAAGLQRAAGAPPPPRPLLQGAAFVIFTSGSTGAPKGVVLTHAAFAGKLAAIDSLLHFQSTDRTLLVLNLSFGFGLWVALLTLLRGGTLVLVPRFEPAALVPMLLAERISQAALVPTMLRLVLADAALAAGLPALAQQGSLRQLLLGGELLGPSLAHSLRAQLPGTTLVDIYGLTETSTCDFFAFPPDFAQRPGCIGRPAPQVQHRIADAQGRPVAPGQTGELQLRSPFLLAGYLDAPALSAAAVPDGWLRTGDLARQHPDGLVELMGRQKDVISRGGHKLTPVEVEQALCSHADVAAALVLGMPDTLMGERIHALVVPRAGAQPTAAALRAHLASRLDKWKLPDAWHLADALPQGRTGKADRGAAAALIAAGRSTPWPA